jgi:murein peptide amidase A
VVVRLALLVVVLLVTAAPRAEAEQWHAVLGLSHQDRRIHVHRFGDFSSPRKILVVGCIHGDECQGLKITKRLARRHPSWLDLWIVHVINPDGRHLGVRQNGRGVDLNRNFGSEWIPIGQRWDPEYSGPRPWSERETRLARGLVRDVRPDVTIWYHQPQALVRAWGHSRPMARRYARLAGEPYRSIRWPHGTAPNWQNHKFRRAAAFVVELPPGRLSAARAYRHARAVRRLLTETSSASASEKAYERALLAESER